MKTNLLVVSLAVFGVIVLTNGCSKEEAPAPTAAQPIAPAVDVQKTAADKAAAAAKADAEKAAQALKAQAEKDALAKADAEKAAQALKDQAEAAKQSAAKVAADKRADLLANVSKVQGLIDTAKKLSGENKWAEALKIVNDLAAQKLTPEQQTIVDGLKQQAQKQAQEAVAKKATDEAEKAIGGLLKPKIK
ncbi:MAG: hypothetical protein HY043_10425 [Verrucomicrobia bacterium]|nr:hypothetical protein [Verrucomicrobiota bacterium]